jgi:methyl-accepting chemotaxis protein
MSVDVQNAMFAFVAVAALALLMQTIGAIAVIVIARKAAKNLREEMEHYRSTLTPILERVRDVVQHVAPKVESAADELAVITTKLREQTADIQAAANDIIARTQHQASRVDHMLTAIFDRMERVGSFVSEAVAKPMRQLSGVIASIRAVVEHLREPQGAPRHAAPASAHYHDGEPYDGPSGGFHP